MTEQVPDHPAADLDQMRANHRQSHGTHWGLCRTCNQAWPCDASLLQAEVAALRAALPGRGNW